MTLENSTVIDAIGTDKASGSVVLTIADSWDWKDERQHLAALQEKINAYFEFIERGQILDSYPDAEGRVLIIDVISRFPMPPSGVALLATASQVASDLGVTITARTHTGPKGKE